MIGKLSDTFSPEVLKTATELLKKEAIAYAEKARDERARLQAIVEKPADGMGYTKLKEDVYISEETKKSKYAEKFEKEEKSEKIRKSVKDAAEGKESDKDKYWSKMKKEEVLSDEDLSILKEEGFSESEILTLYSEGKLRTALNIVSGKRSKTIDNMKSHGQKKLDASNKLSQSASNLLKNGPNSIQNYIPDMLDKASIKRKNGFRDRYKSEKRVQDLSNAMDRGKV